MSGFRNSTIISVLSALVVCCAPCRAEEKPAKPWTDSAEVSVVTTNGNSRTMTSAAKNHFKYGWRLVNLSLEGGGLGSKSEGEVTAERYNSF